MRAAVELGEALLVVGREVVVQVAVDVVARAPPPGARCAAPAAATISSRCVFAYSRDHRNGSGGIDGPHRPDREDERQAREPAPALREVEDVEAREVGLQRGIAEEERRVVVREHLGEVGRGRVELGCTSRGGP